VRPRVVILDDEGMKLFYQKANPSDFSVKEIMFRGMEIELKGTSTSLELLEVLRKNYLNKKF
jgi:hypothetical protein